MVRAPVDSILIERNFELEPPTNPKSITSIGFIGVDARMRLPAIYVLDGDSSRIIAADEGQPRPAGFKTERGLTMRAFVRYHNKAGRQKPSE